MSYSLKDLENLKQRFIRKNGTLVIETYDARTQDVLDTFEFTEAYPGALPTDVARVATERKMRVLQPVAEIQTDLATGQEVIVGADGNYITGDPYDLFLKSGKTADQYVSDIQAAVNANHSLRIVTLPGVVINVNTQILVPSNTTIIIGKDTILRKQSGAPLDNTSQIFVNSDPFGGNVNIRIIGEGTLDFNADNLTGVIADKAHYNGIFMDNVDGLEIGGALKMRNAYKYLIYGSAIRKFWMHGIDLYSAHTGNTGRDGIHIQGNSYDGLIERITGVTNDDFIAINTRDNPGTQTTIRSLGSIRNIVIRDIWGNVHQRSGCIVALYSSQFDNAAAIALGYAAKPTIVSLTYDATTRRVTATTNIPHYATVGDAITVTGSTGTGTGYNVELADVESTPTPTTFTYFVPNTPGAYVSGALLRIYWALQAITVQNIRGNTFSSPTVKLMSWNADSAADAAGFGRNIVFEDIEGTVTTPGTGQLCVVTSVHTKGFRLSAAKSRQLTGFPLFDTVKLAGAEASKFLGATVIDCPSGLPYNTVTASAQAMITLSAYFSNLTVSNLYATTVDVGGGYSAAVNIKEGCEGSNITFINPTIDGNGGLARIYNIANMVLTVEGGYSSSNNSFLRVANSAANVEINFLGGNYPGTGALVHSQGTGTKLTISAGVKKAAGAALLANNGAGTPKLISDGTNSIALPINATSTDVVSVSGTDLSVPLAAAYVARTAGSMVKASVLAGTIPAGELTVCATGGAAGSWKQLTNTANSY